MRHVETEPTGLTPLTGWLLFCFHVQQHNTKIHMGIFNTTVNIHNNDGCLSSTSSQNLCPLWDVFGMGLSSLFQCHIFSLLLSSSKPPQPECLLTLTFFVICIAYLFCFDMFKCSQSNIIHNIQQMNDDNSSHDTPVPHLNISSVPPTPLSATHTLLIHRW